MLEWKAYQEQRLNINNNIIPVNIGIISCHFLEETTNEVRGCIQECLPKLIKIDLNIFSPKEHKDKMTQREKLKSLKFLEKNTIKTA